MGRAPLTVRSVRTREALRRAAVARFSADGVEATSAEQIAADAGVTLRTFYRHFGTKYDLLFADYDSGLQWFRRALGERPAGEDLLTSVRESIFAFPWEGEAVGALATLRAEELAPDRIAHHFRGVQADFAAAVADHIRGRDPRAADVDVAVTAGAVAGSVFGVLDLWMRDGERRLADLAPMTRQAVEALRRADDGGMFRHS